MKKLVVLCVLVAFCHAIVTQPKPAITLEDERTPVLNDQLIESINNANLPWKAGRNPRFEGVSVAQAKKMMGTLPMDDNAKTLIEKLRAAKKGKPKQLEAPKKVALPTSFDSRTQWPGCVHPVMDQGQCGSCWAFGATESLSDRFCIASNNKTNVVLSPQSLVSCDWEGNMGCNGGIPLLAWEYMEFFGVVTLSCFPYTSGNGSTPWCPSSCVNSNEPYTKYYADTWSVHSYWSEEEIMQAIYTGGPIEGAFDVYSDFMTYKSGVYVKSASASYLGGHAIKMVGWGHDDASGLDYWIIQNSWGTDWGMDGYFWIQRGTNMCGIDSGGVAGAPYLK